MTGDCVTSNDVTTYINCDECWLEYKLNTIKPISIASNKAYDIFKKPNETGNKEEENKMKVLEIFKDREIDYIQENYDETIKKIKEEDQFYKLTKKYNEDVKKIYKKEYSEEFNTEYFLGLEFLSKETREKIEKAETEKKFELNNLYEMLEEVEARLEMTDDYDKQVELLKIYEILDEEGRINA